MTKPAAPDHSVAAILIHTSVKLVTHDGYARYRAEDFNPHEREARDSSR